MEPTADVNEQLLERFESLTLPAESFGHAEHVRLAWHLLTTRPHIEALERYARGLRAFASHHGAPGKYHETITFFFLHLIESRLAARPGHDTWTGFKQANADLLSDPGGLLRRHYSAEELNSAVAKGHFLLPARSGIPEVRA